MAEIIRRTTKQAEEFLENAHYDLEGLTVMQVYPGVFPERLVFKTYNPKKKGFRVIKLRPNDQDGYTELAKITSLVDHYLISIENEVNFKPVEHISTPTHLAIDMPFLGYSLYELAQHLDEENTDWFLQHTFSRFSGFTIDEINTLIEKTIINHLHFSNLYNLIHGDIATNCTPNNITYHPGYSRLFLLDAEALTEVTPESQIRFEKQINKVRVWMLDNLIAA